jgi:hypothetical protein
MVKSDVVDLSVSKKAAAKVAPEAAAKPAAVKKIIMRVAKPAEEEVKPVVVEEVKPVVEEVKPRAKGSRFVKGSEEARQWGIKMREAKLAKRAVEGKEVLLEASD